MSTTETTSQADSLAQTVDDLQQEVVDRFEHIQRLAYDDSDLSPNEMLAAAQSTYKQDTSGMEVYDTYQPNP